MQNVASHVPRAAGLSVLALVGQLLAAGPVLAQPQAPPSAPVTVVNTTTNPVPVSATGSVSVTGPIQAQQSGEWTVLETFAPGRTPKRYGPIDVFVTNNFVGQQLVPPVPAGQTFILTHLNAIGYSNNSSVSLVRGSCVLQLRVGDTYTPFMSLRLVDAGSGLTVTEPQFVPVQATEGLYVLCGATAADGSAPSQGFRVTAGGYLVPAVQ